MRVQDLLSKYSGFIAANSDRLPAFASWTEARAELVKLSQRQPPTNDVTRRVAMLSRRNAELSHDDAAMSELRALSKSSADQETAEYDSIAAELVGARSRLGSLKQTLAANRRAAVTAQQSVRDAERALELRRAKAERLRNERAELEQAQRECRRVIRSSEHDISKLNGMDAHAEELEKTAETRAAHLSALDARLSELRSACHSKAEEISQTIAEIESMEERIDRAIDQGFVVIHGSSSGDEDDAIVRELSKEKDELLSERAVVADAVAVIQMPLEDASEVKRKIEMSLRQGK
jgi:chromosome segregation ATPase